jgi:hypothetical protein
MRKTNRLLFLFLLPGFMACQKVIELPLKGSEPKYVIEGMITNEQGVCRVHITQSVNFNEPNVFPAVSGAQVTVKDNGVPFILTETSAGIYETSQLNGIPGHVYELAVQVNGQQFTASGTMPQPVKLDTVYITSGPFGQFKFPVVSYTDPAAANNGYLFVQYVNGVKDPAIFWQDDEFTNGDTVTSLLDSGIDKKDDPRAIHTGDHVTIEMQGLDDTILKYWYTMSTSGGTGQGNIVAPSNPITNIKGGALGYFSAHTVDRRTVVAP